MAGGQSLSLHRKEFPITRKYVYFDHASVGPIPRRSLRAVQKLNEEKLIMGKLAWEEWDKVLDEARRVIASFISAGEDEIALTVNTSEGLGIVTNGVEWKPGDNIVTTDLEFPSSLFACQGVAQRYGVELRVVRNIDGELPLTEYSKAIDEHTKLVVFSHVQFSNGYRTELQELADIAHSRGAMVLVDAIQSLGTMPLDVRREDVDFLACGGYKWLLAPIGVGFLYVRREHLDKIAPTILGYRSDEEVYDLYYRELSLAKNARRFEHGQRNFPGFAGMVESMKMLKEAGLRKVRMRIWRLGDEIIGGAQELNLSINSSLREENRSGIVNLNVKNPEKVKERLLREGIVVSARKGLRVSPHFYNTQEEVERFLLALGKIIKEV
jgi:selenocysteine lyase/cysteine desulfurase